MTQRSKVLQTVCRMVREGQPRTMPDRITDAERAAQCFVHIRDLGHEEFWIVGLNGRNEPIGCTMVGRGGLNGCALLPRDVLRPALTMGASAILVAHNHPSGDHTPSRDDHEMTRALRRACEIVGLPLLDHIVISSNGWAGCDGAGPGP